MAAAAVAVPKGKISRSGRSLYGANSLWDRAPVVRLAPLRSSEAVGAS